MCPRIFRIWMGSMLPYTVLCFGICLIVIMSYLPNVLLHTWLKYCAGHVATSHTTILVNKWQFSGWFVTVRSLQTLQMGIYHLTYIINITTISQFMDPLSWGPI